MMIKRVLWKIDILVKIYIIRLLYDFIFNAKLRKQQGMLLLIDFEKAFDSVSHKARFQSMDFPKYRTLQHKID